jgi:hypothetical protein
MSCPERIVTRCKTKFLSHQAGLRAHTSADQTYRQTCMHLHGGKHASHIPCLDKKVHKPSRLDDHVRFLDIAREHARKRMYTLPNKHCPNNELTDPLSHSAGETNVRVKHPPCLHCPTSPLSSYTTATSTFDDWMNPKRSEANRV